MTVAHGVPWFPKRKAARSQRHAFPIHPLPTHKHKQTNKNGRRIPANCREIAHQTQGVGWLVGPTSSNHRRTNALTKHVTERMPESGPKGTEVSAKTGSIRATTHVDVARQETSAVSTFSAIFHRRHSAPRSPIPPSQLNSAGNEMLAVKDGPCRWPMARPIRTREKKKKATPP